MKTKAKFNPETKAVTLEIDNIELDTLLDLARMGITAWYDSRLSDCPTEKARETTERLRKQALENWRELCEVIANA